MYFVAFRYIVNRLRPVVRLLLITLRPVAVFIRDLNPCFLTRFIFLGWRTRFGIVPYSIRCGAPGIKYHVHDTMRIIQSAACKYS